MEVTPPSTTMIRRPSHVTLKRCRYGRRIPTPYQRAPPKAMIVSLVWVTSIIDPRHIKGKRITTLWSVPRIALAWWRITDCFQFAASNLLFPNGPNQSHPAYNFRHLWSSDRIEWSTQTYSFVDAHMSFLFRIPQQSRIPLQVVTQTFTSLFSSQIQIDCHVFRFPFFTPLFSILEVQRLPYALGSFPPSPVSIPRDSRGGGFLIGPQTTVLSQTLCQVSDRNTKVWSQTLSFFSQTTGLLPNNRWSFVAGHTQVL